MTMARCGFRMYLFPGERLTSAGLGPFFYPGWAGFMLIWGGYMFFNRPLDPRLRLDYSAPVRAAYFFGFGLGAALLVATFIWNSAMAARYWTPW